MLWLLWLKVRRAGVFRLLVGGTMLYYKALLEGLADMPSADPAIRAELEARAASEGWEVLHRELRWSTRSLRRASIPTTRSV
jgi:tRNA A37 N6-isopentenylltransferase MiaA